MAAVLFSCNLCAYATDAFVSFRSHYVRRHKNDANFHIACCIDSCSFTSRNWTTYRVHVHRKHRSVLPVPATQPVHNECDFTCPGSDCLPSPSNFNAQFTLSLAARHSLSHAAIDSVVASTSILVESHLNLLKQQVKSKLMTLGVDPHVIDDIPVNSCLSDFSSNSKRLSYYKQNLVTFLEPEEVVLGYKFISKAGMIKKIPRIGYIIPFEESLKSMLSMPEVWHHVCYPHQSVDEFMRDICDGEYVSNNRLFSQDMTCLEIILNCDDMEIVNPLGSHVKKHTLSMFYYSLANIPPEYRSHTDVIQLVAVAKTRDVREDNAVGKLLANFCNRVNRLASNGIEMDLHGDKHNIKGNLVIVCADTLAANWRGKFKEGVSFALRNCRLVTFRTVI
jgi:hypothetical protein